LSAPTSAVPRIAYEAYLSWCEQKKRPAYTLTSFGRTLAVLGLKQHETNNRVYYIGLHLRDALGGESMKPASVP